MVNATATRKPRQRRKPVRTVKLVQAPGSTAPGAPGTLDIREDGKLTCFWVYPAPADYGRAFRLEKFEGQCRGEDDRVYNVLLHGGQSSCECRGFLRWGHCRHVEALTALRNAGKL
jgi:hypothetical protein